MTDGTPTDDPSREFDVIRQRVESEQLFVFPLGIGESADMARLRNMYHSARFRRTLVEDIAWLILMIIEIFSMKLRVM